MNNIFDKPIIERLFEHRKENFEQYTYDNNDEIRKKYPNVLKVFEKLMPITLNMEEMKLLIELIKLDEKVRTEERKMCFKSGISEVLDF